MNPNRNHLLLLVALISFAGCNGRRTAKEYGYVFYESTGQNQYLLADSRELPFRFDEVLIAKLNNRSQRRTRDVSLSKTSSCT
jgi:hypothetical protein